MNTDFDKTDSRQSEPAGAATTEASEVIPILPIRNMV
jgi:hypothetical protein